MPEVIDIYHGSPKVIERPVFGEGKVHNDYGRGFAFMRRKGLGIKEVVSMYYPLHEADLSKFADAADGVISRG